MMHPSSESHAATRNRRDVFCPQSITPSSNGARKDNSGLEIALSTSGRDRKQRRNCQSLPTKTLWIAELSKTLPSQMERRNGREKDITEAAEAPQSLVDLIC
jgi:hypothetical protein